MQESYLAGHHQNSQAQQQHYRPDRNIGAHKETRRHLDTPVKLAEYDVVGSEPVNMTDKLPGKKHG